MDKLKNANCIWYYFVNANRIMITKNQNAGNWTVQYYSEDSECIVSTNVYDNFDDVVAEVVTMSRRNIYYYIQPLKGLVKIEFPSDEQLKEAFVKTAVIVEE